MSALFDDVRAGLAEEGVGVPLVPVRTLVHGATAPSAADVPRLAAELIAAQFDKLARPPRDATRWWRAA